jgi:DNA repair ATPase RecN
MAMFSKKELKLKQESDKKNMQLCKETVKDIEELYADLDAAYTSIDTVTEEFMKFTDTIKTKMDEADIAKMQQFAKRLAKVDKVARDAVRDVRDILRNQKKRLKEMQREA